MAKKVKAKKAEKQADFILLDRSGSMGSMWTEALSSINSYVKELDQKKVPTKVTLATFDLWGGADRAQLAFEVIRKDVSPSDWKNVTNKDAEPRGGTPLNDATGRIVNLAKEGNYDKVAIIIMTDGHENSSRELSVAQAKALLDECRAKNWQVIFLGANFDNAMQATSYGSAAGQHVNSGVGNMAATMSYMSGTRAAYAATGSSMNFTDEQKNKLKQQGKT